MYRVVILGMKLQKPQRISAPNVGMIHSFNLVLQRYGFDAHAIWRSRQCAHSNDFLFLQRSVRQNSVCHGCHENPRARVGGVCHPTKSQLKKPAPVNEYE